MDPELLAEAEIIPDAELYEPEPYYGCPRCEAHEYGVIGKRGERPIYQCHDCGSKFLGIVGIHYGFSR